MRQIARGCRTNGRPPWTSPGAFQRVSDPTRFPALVANSSRTTGLEPVLPLCYLVPDIFRETRRVGAPGTRFFLCPIPGHDRVSARCEPMETSSPNTEPNAERLLEDVIEPVVHTMGYELVQVEWTGSGRQRKVRVYLDHPEGVTLDDCSRMSPILSNALDAAEVAPEAGRVAQLLSSPYTLEVSSPGLERPLSRRSHFERFTGNRAVIRTFAPLVEGANQRTFHGTIEATEADPSDPEHDRKGVVLLEAQDTPDTYRIPLSQIRRAHLVYEG